MTKYAGSAIRDRRVSRVTGLEVMVVDAQHPETPVAPDAEGDRWATYCPEHGSYVWHATWRTATSFLGSPEEWCEDCRALVEQEGPVQTGPGFSAEERRRAQAARSENARERQKVRDAERARKAEAKTVQDRWAEWVRFQPILSPEWTDAEREEAERLRKLQMEAVVRQSEAKTRIREADRKLNSKPIPKPKEEKELEAERSDAESAEQTAAEEARYIREARNQIARRAYLRACDAAGWKVRRNGSGVELARGDERIPMPPDYVPEAKEVSA